MVSVIYHLILYFGCVWVVELGTQISPTAGSNGCYFGFFNCKRQQEHKDVKAKANEFIKINAPVLRTLRACFQSIVQTIDPSLAFQRMPHYLEFFVEINKAFSFNWLLFCNCLCRIRTTVLHKLPLQIQTLPHFNHNYNNLSYTFRSREPTNFVRQQRHRRRSK